MVDRSGGAPAGTPRRTGVRPPAGARYHQMEIEYGAFERRVTLEEDVDPEGAEATYERGLLTVVMPLAQSPRTGRISIPLGGAQAGKGEQS